MCEKEKSLAEASLCDEEDRYFSKVAEERDTPDAKFVSHEKAWAQDQATARIS